MKDLKELQKLIEDVALGGMRRRIDELGRIVIPIVYRREKFENGSSVYFQIIDDCLLVTENEEFGFGIKKKFDELGRIQVTKEIRDELNWNVKDSIKIWSLNGMLILKKTDYKCVFCDSEDKIQSFKNKFICSSCKHELLLEK